MTIYDTLNDKQKEAVFLTEGPLLLLAGAGSGKTKVLTHRIAYLIEEKGVNPWNILAITFTNKAAKEMRERIDNLVGYGSEDIWVSTFHSMCVRILRRNINKLGFNNSFVIYDTEDQKNIIKDIIKIQKLDTDQFKERNILNEISKAKDEFISPSEYERESIGNFRKTKIAGVYKEYQKRLKDNNALDFDDLIYKTVELFQFNPDVLETYQKRFKYIMVDEYQDTNTLQFKLINQLSAKYRNICLVGDDDQSIYKFRGANIDNILDFEQNFPDANIIKLEQNYRSTKNILDVANAVIKNNQKRNDKILWTNNDDGEKVYFHQYETERDEAEGISNSIQLLVNARKIKYSDCAILYRTNSQSRMFEERFLMHGIPYKILGGINFYQRKEIKDLLAYLRIIENDKDDLSVKRIINVPKRGIGNTSIEKVIIFAEQNNMNLYTALKEIKENQELVKVADKMKVFTDLIDNFKAIKDKIKPSELFKKILEDTKYLEELSLENTDEALDRIQNIDQLLNKIVACEEETEEITLSEVLEQIALVADIDNLDESKDTVVLMTIHSAKGLEFPYVYLVGMEDGVFPSYISLNSENEDDIEEERRLCYVGITRAREKLCLSCARLRLLHGRSQYNKISRFVFEIPEESMKKELPKNKYVSEKSYIKSKKRVKDIIDIPYNTKEIEIKKADNLDYDIGDTVKHIKFGKGVVKNIILGGKDYEVTVDFEKCGIKKMFASFAKLKKV